MWARVPDARSMERYAYSLNWLPALLSSIYRTSCQGIALKDKEINNCANRDDARDYAEHGIGSTVPKLESTHNYLGFCCLTDD